MSEFIEFLKCLGFALLLIGVIGAATGWFLMSVGEDYKSPNDFCLDYGFAEYVYIGRGVNVCCELNKINCKPFEGVKKHKWYGEFCDFLPECIELRGKK